MNQTVKDLIERRSIRAYKPNQVKEEQLLEILEAGKYAASGKGRQPVKMIVVQDKETIEKLSKMNAAVMGADIDPFYGAPTVIVVIADTTASTWFADGTLVIGNLMNAAHAVGVDSCWINRATEVFDSEEGKALLEKWGIKGEYRAIGNCILGYRACGYPSAAPRKEDMVIRV